MKQKARLCVVSAAIALVAGLFSAAAHAADTKNCEDESNMAAIRYCLDQQDSHSLQQVYEKTLAIVQKDNPAAAKTLESDQKHWQGYATDTCDFLMETRLRHAGLYANDGRQACWANLVQRRIRVLRAYRQCGSGPIPNDVTAIDPFTCRAEQEK